MFEYLWALTGLTIVGGASLAYWKTGDAMHPAVVLGPLFGWFYCGWPWTLNADGQLLDLFSESQLNYTSLLFWLAILLLYVGLLRFPGNLRQIRLASRTSLFGVGLPERTRRRIYQLSLFLGLLAVGAYVDSLYNVGGFVRAYSVSKGGGRAASGYVGEALLLSFPAVLLFAISLQGKKVRAADVLLALVMVSPHLLQGTFGGRRGPLFLSLSLLFFSWYVAKGRPPPLLRVMAAVGLISLSVVVVASQRHFLYLGSSGEFDSSRTLELIRPTELGEGREEGNEYVMATAAILVADYWQEYGWGWKYFVTYFIRPIPKEIWPTKYKDMGVSAEAMGDEETQFRYLEAVGFVPLQGSSIGSIADVYVEFSWGVLAAYYLLGRAFAWVWRNHRQRGGIWTVILIEMLILSVYLPSQSLSAWLQRLLFMSVITVLLWKYWIHATPRATPAPPRRSASR